MIPAAATGIGSMPGTSIAESMAIVAGELPEWPFLPELPARGAGADMVGRTAALLLVVARDFALDPVPSGWRRAGQIGPDMRRARSWLGEDLDRLEQVFGSSQGAVKLQMCGPWTWAASVEDGSGRRLVRDDAFVADLADALAHAADSHVAEVARRLPGRQIVLQLDEPALPAVLAGDIPTASGLGRLAAVSPATASHLLGRVTAALDVPVLMHCCGRFPFQVARTAGFGGVSWDAVPSAQGLQHGSGRDAQTEIDAAAETFETGITLLPGVVRSGGGDDVDSAWRRFDSLWSRTGLGSDAARSVAITPSCGLAGADPASARSALAVSHSVAERIASSGG